MKRYIRGSVFLGFGSVSEMLWTRSTREIIILQSDKNHSTSPSNPLTPSSVATKLRHREAGDLLLVSSKRDVRRRYIATRLPCHSTSSSPWVTAKQTTNK